MKFRTLCAAVIIASGLSGPVIAQETSAGTQVVIDELFSSYPSGGDFFASQISRLIRANPDAIDLVLARLNSAPAPQQKAVARAIASVVFAMSSSGDEAQVDAAQALSEKLAVLITCISPPASGEGSASADCPDYANPSMAQFASAYLSIQSGEATAAISAPFTAPAAIGAAPAGGGPLGSSGAQLGGDAGDATTATGGGSLASSNTPSSRGASSSTSTRLLLSPN